LPLDLEKEPDSRMQRFLQGDEDALDGPGIGALEGTRGLRGLGFSLGEGGSMVLSEAAPDSAALVGAATDDLGEETGLGEGRGYRGTGQGCGFGLDKRGRETPACIAMGRCQDFGDSIARSSAGGKAGEVEISMGAGVVIATRASVNRTIRKTKN